ncbi:MAG: hypothetical protein Q7R97_04380 [Candidatus Daviesbacteria bacterium]|nr:hypothetical protein [Candidatus Daviesbacteria bacterium]
MDNTAPETSISLTGDTNSDGSYKTDIKVELSAADNTNGSGIAKIEYSLDNGQTTKTYTDVFTLSDNGTIKVKYRATDNTGNEENPKTKEIIISKPSGSSSSNSDSNSSSSTTSTSSDNQNSFGNQTTAIVANGVKKVLSNILSFNNDNKENNNDKISESINSAVLGTKTEGKNTKNNSINPLIFLPVVILGGFIICKKQFKT